MDDFLDGNSVFIGGSPTPPIVPSIDLDLGDKYRQSDYIYGRDVTNTASEGGYWNRIFNTLSPKVLSDKVSIGAASTVYDEQLYVNGRIYASGGYRLGNAATITQDYLGNLVFSDSIAGSATLAQLLAGGSGNVTVSGTPSMGQLASWVNGNTLQGINASSLTFNQSQIINLTADLAGKASTIHNLVDVVNHPVSGLTNGQFLKAISGTSYGFVAHGLTAADIGLGNVTNNAQVRKITSSTNNAVVRWDGATGDLVQDSLMILSDTGSPNIPAGQTYNVGGVPHTHSGLQVTDATLTALAALDGSVGFIYQTGTDTFTKYGFAGTGSAITVARSDHDHGSTYISDLATYFGTLTANYVYASPDGSAGSPTFRALVSDDIPTLAQSKITNLVSDLLGKQPSSTILTTLSALGNSTGYLYNNGSGTLSWGSPSGSGNVSNSGTPVDNQLAVWIDATHIEGNSGLVYNSSSGLLIVSDTISGSTGTVDVGYSLSIKGGDAYGIGDNNGGDLYLYGGAPNGTGVRGNVYFGTGAAGYLASMSTETNVVYYNPSTGLITYGAAISGGGGDVFLSGTPVDNQIAVWTDDHTIEGTTGLTFASAVLSITGSVILSGGDRSISIANAPASTAGYDITLVGGAAVTASYAGGDVFIYGGAPGSGGTRGNIYFGTGAVGYLPAKGSETNVVYYDTVSGKLSYGVAGTGLVNHGLVSSYHTVSGLTTGHFLKATSSTSFSFGSHGLTYSDVGAAAASHSQAESSITFTDITTGNATTGAHGYLPKLGGGTTNYLRADGTWAAPSGGTSYWQRNGTTLSPLTSGDICQVNTYYVGAAIEGSLTTVANTSFTVSARDGLSGTVKGRDLYLRGGAPYNTSGADGGNVYIRGGAARSGDSGSNNGNVFISPGSPYGSSVVGNVYLGDSSYGSTAVMLITQGSNTNVSLYIRAKGTGNISIVDGTNVVNVYGTNTGIFATTLTIGNDAASTITGYAGISGSVHGKNLTVKGGNAYGTGNNAGGHIYIYGGIRSGTGAYGNTYLAYNGSTAYGYVGIRGPASSSYALYVTGSVYSTSTMNATDFVQTSDKRLKTEIESYVPTYMDIDYKQFRMKSDLTQLRYGVIAQDLARINPALVRSDDKGMLSVSYFDLLVCEIAYLKNKIRQLENECS
jgi:hypothetical protein